MLVKVKKLISITSYFVILLTFFGLVSCKSKNYYNYKAEGQRININEKYSSDSIFDNYITPYRVRITKDLDSVLAFCPETLEKNKGKWETNIGSFLANVTFELSNKIFELRENKSIDFCLLNHGGIRSTIPKGKVTTRTAFNVMPFENSIIIIGLTGNEIKILAKYIINEKKPHPLHGLKIYINSKSEIRKIEINEEPLDNDKLYYIATSDYLANGGDSMTFFRDSKIKFDIDYKIRNLLIDYFKKVDTLKMFDEKSVIEE
ncbi:5'-nucleotidase [uncultured Flavobacterium sp.]|uniref:5'-nucleotidase n=1 Tax=uncultured Flavobacterium sp. TaxID=165435 RepID=UPI0030CA4910|tara:strand:- start:355 stop:1137 length:783 start_codon:yes stop_codon:yes gene_type:complete